MAEGRGGPAGLLVRSARV